MKTLSVTIAVIFLLLTSSANALDGDDVRNFTMPAPTPESLIEPLSLWATYYYMPIYPLSSDPALEPLRDREGASLGPRLDAKRWCIAALQGSVAIRDGDGAVKVYNVDGVGEDMQVDCTPYHRFKKSGRLRFRVADGPYGDGARPETSYVLFPYRSIAVDPAVIPHGSVIYIPAARGLEVELESGKKFVHDGYFFASDKGGAIEDNQIDVYEGVEKVRSFKAFVKSSENRPFEAFLVGDDALQRLLEEAHAPGNDILRAGEF